MGILKKLFGGNSSSERRETVHKTVKTDRQIEKLQGEIEHSGAYIRNLRLDRSWVLPKMVEMAFDKSGKFDRAKYVESVKHLDPDKVWNLIVRNYSTVMNHPDTARVRWWTKNVAVKVTEADCAMLEKELEFQTATATLTGCSGGPYITLVKKGCHHKKKMLFLDDPVKGSRWNRTNSCTVEMFRTEMRSLVGGVRKASSHRELFEALLRYGNKRFSFTGIRTEWPDEFVDAYAGDGAYCSMMTMVKHLGLTYDDEFGRTLSREECIGEITGKAEHSTGMELLDFCEKKFFNGRVFDVRKYRNR